MYKGFDENLRCRGFQYETGKTYEENAAKLCEKGFHACEMPLDVFRYYPPGAKSRYCEVELTDPSGEGSDDSKRVAKKIEIGAEIGIPGLIKAHVDYVKSNTTTEYTDPEKATAGNSGAATAGDSGAATAGDRGAATAGNYGAATAGNYGAATAGNSGAATAGDYGAATAGDSGAATAGNSGAATAGDRGAATARGRAAVGAEGIACARGNDVKVKGGLGSILVLVEEKTDDWRIDDWKVVEVDGEIIKPDTWYELKNGEVVEVEVWYEESRSGM